MLTLTDRASVNVALWRFASWEESRREIRRVIRKMYEVHRSVLERKLEGADLNDFHAFLNNDGSELLCTWALKNLTKWLHQVHGVRPIVLIDEYDAGIHASYANGFYKEASGFFGAFFLAGLKDNEHLERAAMTGIVHVLWESLLCDFNNVITYTLLDTEFNSRRVKLTSPAWCSN